MATEAKRCSIFPQIHKRQRQDQRRVKQNPCDRIPFQSMKILLAAFNFIILPKDSSFSSQIKTCKNQSHRGKILSMNFIFCLNPGSFLLLFFFHSDTSDISKTSDIFVSFVRIRKSWPC